MAERPSATELKRAYRRLGSIPAVAAELGVAYETARRWLRAAGAETNNRGRPSRRAATLNMTTVIARYAKGDSIATIGASLGVSPTTIRKRLLGAGVQLRARPGWPY
jgi:hypothetical protein